MSQRAPSQQNYGSARSPSRTQRPNTYNRQGRLEPQYTEVQIHEDSPTRHDVQFYIRKINRYEVEISRLEHDLSVSQFRLSKAEDFEIKYDSLFKENQRVVKDHEALLSDFDKAQRDLNRLEIDQEQSSHLIRDLQAEVDTLKKSNQGLRFKQEQLRTHSTTKGQEERGNLRQTYNKNLEIFKKESKQIQQKFKKEIQQLKGTISFQETVQSSLSAKLEHIKLEKNNEISRLKELVSNLRDELGNTNVTNEENARASRNQLIADTQDRLNHVRNLETLIEDTLMQEIKNLNETLNKKNREIMFLIECDKKQLQSHESSEKALKSLIEKLEEKIFTIQRENQLELYETIERLKTQYQQNLDIANSQWQQARVAHSNHIDSLRKQINDQKNQIELLTSENKSIQAMHKQAKKENQHSMNMLSQKIIGMETQRDDALKNYTTSMKQIEDDAKSKLDDLHTAIKNKNNETEILNAQINLKNGEITHLLEEISRLRDLNRQKLKKLETTNATEQNNLNKQISDLKQEVFRLKRNLHEIENEMEDNEAQFKLQKQLSSQELQAQKQANELLKSRNTFLAEWCHELERDLKLERVSNVNILHDQNISQRENIQIREEVRVELQAVKNKQVQQIKNIHKLEKNRLQSQLAKREHELRDKKEQLGRLLVQYKALEGKVGKSSKVDKSAEDSAKCRATLESQVKLTENLFNAINCS